MTTKISFKVIAKNVLFNLQGFIIPLFIAILTIPIILNKLGTDKFGVLNLTWIVIGYFGFFDLGIGRALTKIVSEKIGNNQPSEIPAYFWTSIFVMFLFSSFVSVGLYFFSEKLIFNLFKIPAGLQQETINSFYLLIIIIPVVTTSAGLRGFLEAYQRFDLTNVIRIILGVSSFLVPVIVLYFTNSLFWIILFLAVIRIFIWFLYLLAAIKQNPTLLSFIKINFTLIRQIFKLSGWMTLSNITVPIIVYIDRLLIASLISATAVAYYATPYEVITKLLIVPSALTAVLFPTFAANYFNNRSATIRLADKAMKYVSLFLIPVISVIVIFSYELLQIWLGESFAQNSYLILQLLSIGILFNSIAYIPFSFIEGIGRPDITAKLQLIELPIYIAGMWLAIKISGIYGAAFVYMLRMIADCILLIFFSKRVTWGKIILNKKLAYLFLIPVFIFSISIVQMLSLKILLVLIFILLFVFISWKLFLDDEDISLIKSKILP